MTGTFTLTAPHASPRRLLIRKADRIVATADCDEGAAAYTLEDLTVIPRMDDELYDQIIDLIETTAIAGGYSTIVIGSVSRRVRRTLRLLGYAPQTVGRRRCFVRSLDDLPDIRQSNPFLL